MTRWVMGLVVLAGCEATVPLESYCAEREKAVCTAQQRCGLRSAAFDCVAASDGFDCLSPYRAALNAGVVRYDPVAAAKCVKASAGDVSCQTYVHLGVSPVECASVVEVVTPGEAHRKCGPCKAGTRCAVLGEKCGTCQPEPTSFSELTRPAVGEPCDSLAGLECDGDASCRSTNGDEVCVANAALGESCLERGCTRASSCVDGVCVAWAEHKESCVRAACRRGLRCDDGTCELFRPIGDVCAASEQCATNICFEGACVGRRREGESCLTPSMPCDDSSACLDGTCVLRAAEGQSCASSACRGFAQCKDGVCRDPYLMCRP